MHLKVLLVPSLVILTLVLMIGFIRPAISDVQLKSIELESVAGKLANVETAESNVDTLNASLDGHADTETFAKRYLPDHVDQDRPTDMLNYLASQAGVSLTDLQFADVTKIVSQPMVVDGTIDPAIIAETAAMADPEAEAYTVTATIRGSYENIKAFLAHAARMDRLNMAASFGIELDEARVQQAQSGEQPVDPTTDLIGTYQATFPYFAGRPAMAVVSAPVFQQTEVDFGPMNAALDRSTEMVPLPATPQSGRANPFR